MNNQNQIQDDDFPFDPPPSKKEATSKTVIIIIIVVVVVAGFCFLSFIAAIAIPQLLNSRRAAWESRCKLTLRALGSSQLAYADANLNKNYGSWDALVKADYIQEDYTPENFIDNYELVVFAVTPTTFNHMELPNYDSTFKIVAVPRDQKNRLRTFGICDDQTPRVWVGDSKQWPKLSTDFNNLDAWEPLR